jgi:hypothetical protein
MTRFIKGFVVILAVWAAASTGASAQDVGATTNGNWNDPTIWTTGTVPGSSNNVLIGSTVPPAPTGSASIVTVTLTQNQSASNLNLGDGNNTHGTLNLGSNTLTISNVLTIGQTGGLGTITRTTGSFTAATVNVESTNSFTFGSNDVTTNLFVFSGSTATTAAVGNVTSMANVLSGSTLNLGANMNLGANGQLDVENTGSVLNLNGFNASAGTILIGQFGQQPVTVLRGATPGSLTANTMYVANNTLNLVASDQITGLLNLNTNANVTTASTGNVTGNVEVLSGSKLNLGADLVTPSGIVDLQDGGSINANGHAISAINLQVGFFGTGATSVTNAGNVSVESLFLAHGSTVSLQGGSSVSSLLSLDGGSTLNVVQTNGIGLSVTDASPGLSFVDSASDMHLIFTSSTPGSWDFRWADPSNGNWITTLQQLINAGQISFTLPQGFTYSLVDTGGFTYIEEVALAVPEPSSLVLALLGTVGMVIGVQRRRRSGR